MTKKQVHVAVGVILREDGAILIAKRPEHAHQGGLWEFPGGKVEPQESVRAALTRELHEELDIQVGAAQPLIQISHDYGDKSVLLDVWTVNEFSGIPNGKEGQPLRWCAPQELRADEFPAANVPIIHALQLPSLYWITPEPEVTAMPAFWQRVQQALELGVRLIQLRSKQLSAAQLKPVLVELMALAKQKNAKVLVNQFCELVDECDGVHLTSSQLQSFAARPISSSKWLAVSCHSAQELARAAELNCDFAVLSPVKQTQSHPTDAPLGWERFAEYVKQAKLPVYALGGMSIADAALAKQAGGQGIAGISQLF